MSVKKRVYKFKGSEAYVKRYSRERITPLFDDGIADILSRSGYEAEYMPRSVYRPHKLYEALSHYEDIHNRPFKKDYLFNKGVQYARNIFHRPYYEDFLEPLMMNGQLSSELSNPKASAGLTWYGKNKSDAFEFGLQKARRIIQSKVSPEPCLAMARTQKNDKTRLVWCYPLTMNIIESLYARPLIDRFKTFKSPMHFGVPQRVTSSNLRRAARLYSNAYSLDYSQFDASLSRELIYEAFKILRTWFEPQHIVKSGESEFGWDIVGSGADIWNLIVNYFVTSPIVMPDGYMYYGRRNGVPSGSYFTQIIDSICNVILVGMVAAKFNLAISEEQLFVLGDDCLIFSNQELPLQQISEFLHSRKVTLSAEKCEVSSSDRVHFLGRDWLNGKPTADMQDLINKITQPESFRKYSSHHEFERSLVLKSYASVYHNFVEAYAGTFKSDFPITFESLELHGAEVNPRYLSGLMRFQQQYFGNKGSSGLLATVWK